MEKTLITKAIFYLAGQLLKYLARRTDNKIDDKIIETVESAYKM